MAFLRMKRTAFGIYWQLDISKRPTVTGTDGVKRKGSPKQKVILTLPKGTYSLKVARRYWRLVARHRRIATPDQLANVEAAFVYADDDGEAYRRARDFIKTLPNAKPALVKKAEAQIELLDKWIRWEENPKLFRKHIRAAENLVIGQK